MWIHQLIDSDLKIREFRRPWTRLRRSRLVSRPRPPAQISPIPPGCFEVLCRVDAYADYVAVVEAETAEEAAELAYDDHGTLKWEHGGTCEFDARLYVALDADGGEIEGTEVGDR